MGLLSRKKRPVEDVALPLPELDADGPAPAADAAPAAQENSDTIDLSVAEAAAEELAPGEAQPSAVAPSSDGENTAGDDLELFRGLSYVNPETELLLSRVKDVSAAELLASLREVRAALRGTPGGGLPAGSN